MCYRPGVSPVNSLCYLWTDLQPWQAPSRPLQYPDPGAGTRRHCFRLAAALQPKGLRRTRCAWRWGPIQP
jgi:hypothetical protein